MIAVGLGGHVDVARLLLAHPLDARHRVGGAGQELGLVEGDRRRAFGGVRVGRRGSRLVEELGRGAAASRLLPWPGGPGDALDLEEPDAEGHVARDRAVARDGRAVFVDHLVRGGDHVALFDAQLGAGLGRLRLEHVGAAGIGEDPQRPIGSDAIELAHDGSLHPHPMPERALRVDEGCEEGREVLEVRRAVLGVEEQLEVTAQHRGPPESVVGVERAGQGEPRRAQRGGIEEDDLRVEVADGGQVGATVGLEVSDLDAPLAELLAEDPGSFLIVDHEDQA